MRLNMRKVTKADKCGVTFASPSIVGKSDPLTVLVKTCAADGLAAQAGLQPGDRLIRIVTSRGHTVVTGAKHAADLLATCEGEIVLVIERAL